MKLNTDKIEVKETEMLKGRWMTLDEINEVKDKLEGWSSIALEILNHGWGEYNAEYFF